MGLIRGIQIIGILFGLLMAYYTFVNYKKKQIKRSECILWMALWVLFIIASLVPDVLKMLATSLQVYRTMDFLIILGFFFLIIITFHNYLLVKKTSYKLETVVRRIAIKRVNKVGKMKKRKG